MANEERLQVLDMIASGKITAQQGVELLKALDDEDQLADSLTAAGLPLAAGSQVGESEPPVQPEPPQVEAAPAAALPPIVDTVTNTPVPEEPPAESQSTGASGQANPTIEDLPEHPSFDPRAKKWQGWWRIPLWIGVIATVLTGLLMYSIYRAGGFGFWFACSWFPFLISVGIVALAWASRSAHWIHIRVHQSPGERPQNIAISFPVPLGLMAWFLRTFRSKIPNMNGINPDEMVLALNHVTPEKPFYVEVNEEDGQRVEVYIG